MIDLEEVGSHVDPAGRVRFGIYLPGITAAKGYSVLVRIIHAADQFTPEIPPVDFPLAFDPTHELGLWSATVDIPAHADPASHFGQPGRYLYRYQVLQQQARGNSPVGRLGRGHRPVRPRGRPGAARRLHDRRPGPSRPRRSRSTTTRSSCRRSTTWSSTSSRSRSSTRRSTASIARLDYLAGLGVNALELMPVTDFPQVFDWGYGPLHFLAPEDRWGGADGLKRLVKACHARGSP